MWYVRKIVGDSMMPAYKNGHFVVVSHSHNHRVGDVVVAFMDSREVIKRITKMKNGKVYLEGDNKNKSTDSRIHGWLVDTHVVGKIIWPKR